MARTAIHSIQLLTPIRSTNPAEASALCFEIGRLRGRQDAREHRDGRSRQGRIQPEPLSERGGPNAISERTNTPVRPLRPRCIVSLDVPAPPAITSRWLIGASSHRGDHTPWATRRAPVARSARFPWADFQTPTPKAVIIPEKAGATETRNGLVGGRSQTAR